MSAPFGDSDRRHARLADATATAEALTAFCRERLAGYKVPARIVFKKRDEFPLTATGKVQKPRLREELERLCAP